MFHLISDFHGNISSFKDGMLQCPKTCKDIFLLGDIGFGFPEFDKKRLYGLMTETFSGKNFYLIQGNHDYLGEMDNATNVKCITTDTWHKFVVVDGLNILLIPGAYSYDKHLRIVDVSWWPTEELSYEALENVTKVWNLADVIISHDAPLSSYLEFFPQTKISKTNATLDVLLQNVVSSQKPIHWYHGHLHYGYHQTIGNLQLIGVRQDSSLTVF